MDLPERLRSTFDFALLLRIRNFSLLDNRNRVYTKTPPSLLESLPQRKFVKSILEKNNQLEDESYCKCQICLENYEEGEEIKTLQCCISTSLPFSALLSYEMP
jgi:hypothetical protein